MYAAVNLVSDKISVWYNYKAWSFERLVVFWEKNARRSVAAYELILSEEIVSCRVFKFFFIGQKIERHVFVQRIDMWISTHWFELATNRRTPSTLKSQTGACSMCYFNASHGKSFPTVLRSHGYHYKRCRIFLQSGRLDRSL